MEAIGDEERLAAMEHNKQFPRDTPKHQSHVDSFWPQDCSPDLTHVAADPNDEDASLRDDQKFLPVHYFDTICGSSTGGCVRLPRSVTTTDGC
jgi:hypothetical protein